jgi:hypothetical protein
MFSFFRPFAAPFFATIAMALAVPSAHADDPTIAGLWKQIDVGTDFVGGLIFFRENKGVWEGYIVKMYPHPGDPADPVCTGCIDDRKDQPVLGMRLVEKAKRDGLTYQDGNILDPRNGSTYGVEMTLSPDNQTLVVRGYLGITLLGQSQEWKRVSDDEMKQLEADHVTLAYPPTPDHGKQDHSKPSKKKAKKQQQQDL